MNVAYPATTLTATGGTGVYVNWAVTAGTLPAGLTLSTGGILSGTPSVSGTSNFTVQVTDSASATATKSFVLTISAAALSITTASPLPNGQTGVPYSQTLAATGGTPGYTWSLYSGSLPSGLTLYSSGTLSGTPAGSGTSNFTVLVADSASATATKSFALTISPATLSITTSSPLPNGQTGVPYSQTLAATGGTPGYTWWQPSGSLPTGLTLYSNGTLSGTPTGSGTSFFTVQVEDATSTTATQSFALTSPAPPIGTSSSLHVNLSFMPFSNYDDTHEASSYGFSTSCPSGAGIRTCFRTILGNMRAQGVSGVRILVTFCASDSLAFANCGAPWDQVSWNPSSGVGRTWIQNVATFFQDVRAAGIQNVTITTGYANGFSNNYLPMSQTVSPSGSCATGSCCPDTPDPVYFNPAVPYGAQSDGTPIGWTWPTSPNRDNQGWNCAPINSRFFLGWTNLFNVVNAMLGAASGVVTVNELEFGQQEIDLVDYPAQFRYIYDNSMPESAGLQAGQYVDVLSNLRSLMSANGFDPGLVTWSAQWDDSYTATLNCANIYADYSRQFDLDALAQAIGGGWIGMNDDVQANQNLLCGGTDLSSMFQVPYYNTQPNIVDAHMYPQVVGGGTTQTQIQQVAALDYGDLPHFLGLAGLQSAQVMIGETYAGTIYPGNPTLCWNFPTSAPTSNVAGFNQSALAAYSVVFRPWMQLEDPAGTCFPYGGGPGSPTSTNYQNVNYSGQGPYTPISH